MALVEEYEHFLSSLRSLPLHPRHGLLMACIRSIVQTSALCLFDIAARRCADAVRETVLRQIGGDEWFRSDSGPVRIIEELTRHIRDGEREPWRECCAGFDEQLLSRCNWWIEHRNEVAHGVPNEALLKEGVDKLELLAHDLIEVFRAVLPVQSNPPLSPQHDVMRSVPEPAASAPHVFRRLALLTEQPRADLRRLDPHEHRVVVGEIHPHAPVRRFLNVSWMYQEWTVAGRLTLARIPARPSGFLHREDELGRMTEWWDDGAIKTVLFVHSGVGGVGKTTLVLEFLYRACQRSSVGYVPRIVCFGSAKRTRYDASGFHSFESDSSNLEEFADRINLALRTQPLRQRGQKRWAELKANLQRHAIHPRDVVLVIDNAETVVSAAEPHTNAFARAVDRIAADVGVRVIVTSRRDEDLAHLSLIRPGPLSLKQSIELARLRAAEPPVPTVLDAGPALERAVRRLDGVPLLVETMVERVRRFGESLDAATRSIAAQDESGLAEFLYRDAWQRIGEAERSALLGFHLLGPSAASVVRELCAAFDTHWIDRFERFQDAVREARWFEAHRYPGGGQDLVLIPWAGAFLQSVFDTLDQDDKERIERGVHAVRERVDSATGEPLPSMVEPARKAFHAWKILRDHGAAIESFGKALEVDRSNVALAVEYARCCIEAGPEQTERLLVPPLSDLLSRSMDGALMLLQTAASLPRAPEEFEQLVSEAPSRGIDEIDVSLARARFALTRLRHWPTWKPDVALRQMPGESEAAFHERKAQAAEVSRRRHEDEQDQLRRDIRTLLDPLPKHFKQMRTPSRLERVVCWRRELDALESELELLTGSDVPQ